MSGQTDYFATANWSRSWMKPITTIASKEGVRNRYMGSPKFESKIVLQLQVPNVDSVRLRSESGVAVPVQNQVALIQKGCLMQFLNCTSIAK